MKDVRLMSLCVGSGENPGNSPSFTVCDSRPLGSQDRCPLQKGGSMLFLSALKSTDSGVQSVIYVGIAALPVAEPDSGALCEYHVGEMFFFRLIASNLLIQSFCEGMCHSIQGFLLQFQTTRKIRNCKTET